MQVYAVGTLTDRLLRVVCYHGNVECKRVMTDFKDCSEILYEA